MPKVLTEDQIRTFERDGCLSPVRAMSAERARHYRERFEALEGRVSDIKKMKTKSHLLCPWVVGSASAARALAFVLVLVLLPTPLVVAAEQGAKPVRIGVLGTWTGPGSARVLDLFRQALRERGWIEGQNIVIEYRSAEGRLDRLPDVAAELIRLKVDVIFAPVTAAAVAAHNATRALPIVTAIAADPVGLGIAVSLARPGGNVTDLTSVGPEIIGKQLALLKEVVPKVSRVIVLGDPSEPNRTLSLREVEVAGRSLGVQLQVLEARGPNEFDSAFAAMVRQRAGALLVIPGNVTSINARRLAELAARNRLPAVHGWREFVEAGGLLAYGPNLSDLLRQAVSYVDKILKGAKPADLPIEQPTKFELVINLKTAKTLGLTIPPSVLARADHVVE